MSYKISRRNAIITGLAGALYLPGCSRDLPPTYGSLLRCGDTFTYASHRALLSGQSLAREYSSKDITSFPAIGTTDPTKLESDVGEAYQRLKKKAFVDWRLQIEGLVDKPGGYSLVDLRRHEMQTQCTRHTCEEGWSAIAEWTGVRLSRVLSAVGMKPEAKFVSFFSFDDWADSIDMLDALHPQTMLAYGMNGKDLPIAHGAPVRLRVEKQLGYKSMKYVNRIVVGDKFDDGGEKGSIQNGWSWYAGI